MRARRRSSIPTNAGHVSRAVLSRYSHVRMETTRRALGEVAAPARGGKRKEEAERRQQAEMALV